MSTETTARPGSASFDPQALLVFLDGPYHELRVQVREELSKPEYAKPVELPRAEYRELVLQWLRRVAATEGTGQGFPVEYGGGGDPGANVAAFETTAHHDLSLLVKIGVHYGLWGGAVLNLGTKVHHDKYIPDTLSVELPGCFAMTETGHGSDVQALRTTATYDAATQEFVVNTPDDDARKDYIGNSAVHGQVAAVFAQLIVGGESHGIHTLVVPLRDKKGKLMPGIRIEDDGPKLGLNGVDNGRIWFDQVRVPREALLNRYANVSPEGEYSSPIKNPNARFFTMLSALIQGRVCVGGAGISAAKNALTIAIRYADKRRQFAPPGGAEEVLLLDYRLHQRRLLPLLARTYALHFVQEKLAAQFHEAFTRDDYPELERRRLESFAAGVKSIATWHATDTIQTCREACGGAGYLAENQFSTLKADTDVFTTFEGDNTVLLQLVAKGLLTDYKDEFGDLNPIGLVRFVAGQAVDELRERTGFRHLLGALVEVVPGVEDPMDFPDRGFATQMMRWHEGHILTLLARRIKGGIDQGFDPFEVFSTCQDHVVAAARAHVDRLINDAFVDAVDRCDDATLSPVLGQLCDLNALISLERNKAFYLEHGRMSSVRTKAVTRAVVKLCGEIRPHARALVDAFGIPDQLLAAPIAID